MRYLILIILTSIFLLTTVKVEARSYTSETKQNGNNSNNLLSTPYALGDRHNVYVFQPGESNYDRDRRVAQERDTRLRDEAKRRQKVYAESSGGYGEAERLYEDQTNDCVTWVKIQKGIPKGTSLGNGARRAINSHEPQVGAIGAERGRVHAVLIVAINGDDIVINESNFYKGWITQRVLHREDFIGFII